MRIRSRFLRVLLIVVAVLLVGGYLAFATFFFNPFESDYEADVSTLIPRDVDFFVAKARLSEDFEPFPTLSVQAQLEGTAGWKAFVGAEPGRSLERGYREQVAALQAQLAQFRSLDLLAAFGGRDLALAGYFRAPSLAQSEWAVYGRSNWIGKLGASALAYPGLLGLQQQGLDAKVDGALIALSGAQLPRELFVTRVRDVVIAGTSRELVAKALELDARAGQESFGQGATYNDGIARARRGVRENEIEVFVDWRKLSEALQLSGRWPDVQSQEPPIALAARLFQLGMLRSAAGLVGFDQGVVVDVDGELSSEVMSSVQKSMFRMRGRESDKIVRDLASLPRSDCQLLVHLEIGLGDLLRESFASLDDSTRQLVDDALRSTGQYGGAGDFIDELDRLFKGRVGVIVRDNDYRSGNPDKDPPHNDVPVPAIAVVLWTADPAKARTRIAELHTLVSYNQGRLGLSGPEGAKAVYTNRVLGGFEVWEFWSPFIDGTGHLATVLDNDRFILSNSFLMLGDLLRPPGDPAQDERLSDRADFTQLVSEGLPHSNLFAWVDPRRLSRTLRAFAERGSVDAVRARIDWERERALEEEKVIRELFPGKVRGRLAPEEQAEVNAAVNPRLDGLQQRLIEEQAPVLRAEMERNITYLEMCSGALALLALDPKKFELTLSAIVPLDR